VSNIHTNNSKIRQAAAYSRSAIKSYILCPGDNFAFSSSGAVIRSNVLVWPTTFDLIREPVSCVARVNFEKPPVFPIAHAAVAGKNMPL
jgi:hypothetical protein